MSSQLVTGDLVTATNWNEIERKKPTQASVATAQSRTNVAYGDMATVGPAVTVTTGTSALCTISSHLYGGGLSFVAVAVSGATTRAGVDGEALRQDTANGMQMSRSILITGLTAGSNTFTLKYRSTSGAINCQDRYLIVTPQD